MAKIKTGDLTGPALDWAVQEIEYQRMVAEGEHVKQWVLDDHRAGSCSAHYSTDWLWGGPLLNQHKISRTIDHSGLWIAYAGYNLNDEQRHMQCDRSELVAGLRCLVALNLGEVVDVPEEML